METTAHGGQRITVDSEAGAAGPGAWLVTTWATCEGDEAVNQCHDSLQLNEFKCVYFFVKIYKKFII